MTIDGLIRKLLGRPVDKSGKAPALDPAAFDNWALKLVSSLPPIGAGEVKRIGLRRAIFDGGKVQHVPAIDADAAVAGLTLSGGGIRSATFSLGIIRELAAQKLLHRFDYLSTVSGGSYVGSYYCGLFAGRGGDAPVLSPKDFPDPFSDRKGAGRASLDWLRQSGRYLAPTGSGDYWYAVGLLVRNWIGLHLVIGSILMFAALIAVGFRMLMLGAIWPHFGLAAKFPLLWAPLLIFLALPAAIHVACGWAYWLTRRDIGPAKGRPSVAQAGSAVILLASTAVAWRGHAQWSSFGSPAFIALLVACAALGGSVMLAVSLRFTGGCDEEICWDRRRLFLTRPLGWSMIAFAGVLAAAVADALGFWLYRNLYNNSIASLLTSPALVAVLVPAGRWLVPRLLHLSGPSARPPGEQPFLGKALVLKLAAALSAILLIVAVVSFWTILAYKMTWPTVCAPASPSMVVGKGSPVTLCDPGAPAAAAGDLRPAVAGSAFSARAANGAPKAKIAKLPRIVRPWAYQSDAKPELGMPWRIWGGWIVSLAFLAFCIGRTREFLNLSGLTSFYAGRLRRAYLGAGNRRRIAPGENDDKAQPALDRWEDQDDVVLEDGAGGGYYAPGTAAPLHLINITLNETRGRGSNIIQRDRHGRNLVISPEGIYYTGDRGGTLIRIPIRGGEHEPLPLSTWVAISGAAFSTGLGSQTGFPVTQLAGLANIRLGYWWRRNWQLDRSLTQYFLLRELRGDFSGPDERYWYLTDGGHFENTGAYELLRRRVPLIVISDNGMDQQFEYEDVADLVRKARIDFDCEIDFLGAAELKELLGHDALLYRTFGTLSQIAGRGDPAPYAVAALARARFDDGAESTIILIKPRLTGDGPADLIRYKALNIAFPQQTTLDMFFDEAQWESYYHLGQLITRAVFRAPVANGWYPASMRPLPPRTSPA